MAKRWRNKRAPEKDAVKGEKNGEGKMQRRGRWEEKPREAEGRSSGSAECLLYLLLSFEVPKVLEELRFGGELGRFKEMQEAEEFFHCVLEGRAGQQHFVLLVG